MSRLIKSNYRDAAIQYALRRLERDLPPILTHHNLWHMAADVLPAARRLAALGGVAGEGVRLALELLVQQQPHLAEQVVRRIKDLSFDVAHERTLGVKFNLDDLAAFHGLGLEDWREH